MDAGSIYFISDKEYFEGLVSAKKQITEIALRQIALQRGLLLSKQLRREEIVAHLSALSHDYFSISDIADRVGHTQRRARCIKSTLTSAVAVDQAVVEAALARIRDNYASSEVGTISFSREDEASFSMQIKYTETDLSRTTLQQKQDRSAEIQISVTPAGVEVRAPANDMGGRIIWDLKNQLAEDTGQEFRASDIDLSGVTDPAMRTSFFTKLMDAVPNMRAESVVKVKVSSKIDVPTDEDEEGGEHNEEERTFAKVLQAELDGSDLMQTPEYQRMISEGFFIADLRFRARDVTMGHVVEFIAGFSNPSSANGFHFDAAAISYRRDTANISFRSLQGSERMSYLQRLEHAATAAYSEIVRTMRDEAGDEG